MIPQKFKAPFLPKEQIWQIADDFRDEVWPEGNIPLDIMSVVEFELDMQFRAIPSLRSANDIDALLLGDWQTILVDQELFMDDRYSNRLRFSIAHELGHYVLHQDVFKQIPRTSVEDWIHFMCNMPDKEYSFIEHHAYEFAGRFMVPPAALEKWLRNIIEIAERNGIPKSALTDDQHLAYLSTGIAKAFDLSSEVIERRLKKECLWPLQCNPE